MGAAPQVLVSTRGRRTTAGFRPALDRHWAVGAWSPGHDRASTVGRRLPDDQWSSPSSRCPRAGRRPTVARRPWVDAKTCGATPNFLNFLNLKKKNFWKFGRWAKAFGRMGVHHLHFLKLAPTLGSANFSKIHGEWRFHFFQIFFLPKFSPYLDLPIYHWDFCIMKNLIH
jgi:hypothetical protein